MEPPDGLAERVEGSHTELPADLKARVELDAEAMNRSFAQMLADTVRRGLGD
jgi:hypothetical protein